MQRHALRLREPLQTSYGAVAERELLIVVVTDEDGVSGYGEAAPLEAYDGVSIARVEAALERYRPVVEGADRHERRGNRRRLPPRWTICRRRSRQSTWRFGTAPGGAWVGRLPRS